MSLDKLLKENAAWLDQALKRRVFEKVDEKATKFPEEQRERRMGELKSRIEDLARRKEESVASYDRAIALEQAELESLGRQKPPAAPPLKQAKPKKDPQPRPKRK